MYSNPEINPLPHLDYRWVFLASLLLSAWLIAWDPLINRDAIIYLRSADAYLQEGFAASQRQYGRPLLSLCMAWIHQLTGLSLLHAGLGIITLSYAVLCTGFVATVHTLGGDRRVQWLAAIVVLSHPILNHSRSAIMRDPLYWALIILAFRDLLLYVRLPALKNLLRWFAFVTLASLFRFEGLFFALLSPLALLFCPDLKQRLRHCLYLLLPQLLALTALLSGVLLYQNQLGADAALFPAILKYVERLLAFPAEFSRVATEAAQPILQFTARKDARVAALAGLFAVLLLNIARAMTWPWLALLLWSWQKKLLVRFRSSDAILLKSHLLIGFIYLALFILINRFMLERYGSQLVVFLLLYIPFAASALWQAGGWRKYLIVAVLLGMTADTLHTGEGKKAFIHDSTEWVKEHTPPDSTLVSNEKYIAYFSERNVDWEAAIAQEFQLNRILAKRALWQDKDYLVFYVRGRQENLWSNFLERNTLQELQSFPGGGKGRVAVVKLSH